LDPALLQRTYTVIDTAQMKLYALFNEVKLFAITHWTAGCAGSQRDWWDDMGEAWYDEITSDWRYIKDGKYVNGNIADSWFTDADVVYWGDDHNYVDEADVAMICLHGSDVSSRWQGSVRVDETGPGDCDASQEDMEFGDLDLEFLHLSSCNSCDDNQWFFNWAHSFEGLHQVDGFHGCMWIGSSFPQDYEDFASDAFNMSIAVAWLENMYRTNINGAYNQCPVVYGVGSNRNDTWNRLLTEQYDNILTDPTHIGYVGVLYICNCDPECEDVCGSDAWSGAKRITTQRAKREAVLSTDYYRLVESALPRFDKRILSVMEREDDVWDKITLQRVLESARDDIQIEARKDEPVQIYRDKGRFIHLDRMKGKLRYINEERQYQLDKFVEEPVDSAVAVQAVEEVIKYFMIPDVALMLLRLRGICAMGAEYNQVTIADRFILERLITMERMIDGIPVFNSKASFAVNNRGEISRIFLRWPSFRMTPDLRLKSRDHLVSEIVGRLVKALEGRPIELRIQMAYIPVEDEEIRYVPGLVVSAMDNASPILFTVNAAH
jgi:hypothetical protein